MYWCMSPIRNQFLHEPDHFHLGYTPREDLEVATNVTIPANSIDRVLIPIHATDDLIAEEEECIAVILSHLMQPLYTINRTSNGGYSTICIQDNDGEEKNESWYKLLRFGPGEPKTSPKSLGKRHL